MVALDEIAWHARSDVGLKLTVNEDSFCLPDFVQVPTCHECPGALFAVADGLGGHLGGEIASKMACDLLMEFYEKTICQAKKPLSAEFIGKALLKAFYSIDKKVRDHALANKACEDMGTTLSALLIADAKGIVVHVGDSRVYRMREKKLEQLTSDHNFVQEMIAEGEMRPLDAANHPLRNLLTQTVGTAEPLYEVFTSIEDVQVGDCFILCSDGLHGMISDTVILDTLFTYPDPVKATERLLALALANGGRDNVTVIVIQI